MTRRSIMLAEQRAAWWYSCQNACATAVRAHKPMPACKCLLLPPLPPSIQAAVEDLYEEMNR